MKSSWEKKGLAYIRVLGDGGGAENMESCALGWEEEPRLG